MTRLAGKSALTTGSSRRIGRAFCEAYVGEGAPVAMADDDIERARESTAASGVVYGERHDEFDAFFATYEVWPPGRNKREVGAAVPHGRMGPAEALMRVAVFLASNEADSIAAQTRNVEGGNWMN